ncbi:hypothetical protein B0F86_06480 [Pseudomonas syringae]|nr:hypothetical protein B0F86_06480 [Pseudomonas syringae]
MSIHRFWRPLNSGLLPGGRGSELVRDLPGTGSKADAERPERHADAERRTIVEIIVPHAPAWECRS